MEEPSKNNPESSYLKPVPSSFLLKINYPKAVPKKEGLAAGGRMGVDRLLKC